MDYTPQGVPIQETLSLSVERQRNGCRNRNRRVFLAHEKSTTMTT